MSVGRSQTELCFTYNFTFRTSIISGMQRTLLYKVLKDSDWQSNPGFHPHWKQLTEFFLAFPLLKPLLATLQTLYNFGKTHLKHSSLYSVLQICTFTTLKKYLINWGEFTSITVAQQLHECTVSIYFKTYPPIYLNLHDQHSCSITLQL